MDYTFENESLRCTVHSRGAELCSVVDRATGAEMMWQADPAVWPRTAPVLFPYCGRLKDGKYVWKDVTYEGGQHGFARDLEHSLETSTPDSLTFCLEANALTMEKFPFPFKLRTAFVLAGRTLRQTITVVNDGDEEMPFGLGFHPGFACPFDAQHSVSDYAVVFDVPETPTVIETGEKTGLCTGRERVYFERGTEIPLSDTLFDRDSICFSRLTGKTISLVEKPTGRRVTVETGAFPYVLLWSAPGPLRFLCIEPWHTLPDPETASGRWADKRPAITLVPGSEWSTELKVEFAR